MRFSTLAHARHTFCNPLSSATVDAAIARLDLPQGARVLDAGCGKGEMLIRACARWNARGVGVDPNAAFLAEARERAAGRVPAGAVTFVASRMEDATFAPGSFDAALCVGASHAFGGLRPALAALRALLKPRGVFLIGEGCWRREPDDEYLASFGATRDELQSHEANAATMRAAGFEPIESWPASAAEWEAYESLYHENIERFAAEHPNDPDRDAMLERSRSWWASYRRWGRDTMGFALDLSRR